MFLKTFLAVTLFTSLLPAAGPSDSDVFRVRSFIDPETKAKIPITAEIFGATKTKLLAALAQQEKGCAIPLRELKVDKIERPVSRRRSALIPILPQP